MAGVEEGWIRCIKNGAGMSRYDTPEGKIPMPIISLGLMAVIVAFAHILPIAFEREERRQQIVAQKNCEQYGDTMNQWAKEKGLEQPCLN